MGSACPQEARGGKTECRDVTPREAVGIKRQNLRDKAGSGGWWGTPLRSGSGPGHHDLAHLWWPGATVRKGPAAWGGDCAWSPQEGPQQEVNCLWDKTAPMPSHSAPSPWLPPSPGRGRGGAGRWWPEAQEASKVRPQRACTPAGLHPHGRQWVPALFPKALRLHKTPGCDGRSPHSACGQRGSEAPWKARPVVSQGVARCCVKVKGRQGGREGEETGEEERARHSPGSTFIHLRKESSSHFTSGLYTVTCGPFSSWIGVALRQARGAGDEASRLWGAAGEPHPGPSPGPLGPPQSSPGPVSAQTHLPGTGHQKQTGSHGQGLNSDNSSLLQLCTVTSHILNLYLITQRDMCPWVARTDRKALRPGSHMGVTATLTTGVWLSRCGR